MTTPSDINRHALLAIVEALRNDDVRVLEQFGLSGIDEELADSIRNLSLAELSCLSDFRVQIAQITFDLRSLALFLKFAAGKSYEDYLISKAIRLGIRQHQLEQLKGTTRREFDERRRRIGIAEHSRGRIVHLNEKDEQILFRAWDKHKSITDTLDRYVTVSEETGIPIDRAWATLYASIDSNDDN